MSRTACTATASRSSAPEWQGCSAPSAGSALCTLSLSSSTRESDRRAVCIQAVFCASGIWKLMCPPVSALRPHTPTSRDLGPNFYSTRHREEVHAEEKRYKEASHDDTHKKEIRQGWSARATALSRAGQTRPCPAQPLLSAPASVHRERGFPQQMPEGSSTGAREHGPVPLTSS